MDDASSRNAAARVLAIGALLATVTALAVVVTQAPQGATASGGHAERLEAVADASDRLTAALGQLAKGRSAAPARTRVRAALEQLEATAGWLEATPGGGEPRLANALERHREYLDAVGSALANPRSPLRHELAERARRVRAAYASLPEGVAIEGTDAHLDELRAYVAWRRSRL